MKINNIKVEQVTGRGATFLECLHIWGQWISEVKQYTVANIYYMNSMLGGKLYRGLSILN